MARKKDATATAAEPTASVPAPMCGNCRYASPHNDFLVHCGIELPPQYKRQDRPSYALTRRFAKCDLHKSKEMNEADIRPRG